MSLALNTKHLSSFIKEEEYQAIYPQVEAAHKMLEAKNGPGNDFLGWMYLPREYDKDEFARIKEAAAKIREDSDVLVVAGIGGSYLGARAVVEAVKGQFHNELDNGLKIYFCGNSISPGYMLSGIHDNIPQSYLDEIAKDTPMQRFGTMDEIGGLVAFLLSDLATFITGSDVLVDGGHCVW